MIESELVPPVDFDFGAVLEQLKVIEGYLAEIHMILTISITVAVAIFVLYIIFKPIFYFFR